MKKFMFYLKEKVKEDKGWGIAEVLAAVVGVVVVVAILSPAIKSFSSSLVTDLTMWWEGVTSGLFGA